MSEEKVGSRTLSSTSQIDIHGFILLSEAVRSIHNLTVIKSMHGAMLFGFTAKLLPHNRYLTGNDVNYTQQEFVFCYCVFIMLTCIKKLKQK